MIPEQEHRLRRIFSLPMLGPIILILEATGALAHVFAGVEFISHFLAQYGIWRFFGSPLGLVLISLVWTTVLVAWPDRKNHIRLLKWKEADEGQKILNRRLRACQPNEIVRFISITGKSTLLPGEHPNMKLAESAFPHAVKRGVSFRGLLLDPELDEAVFRSEIETPGAPASERLLQADSLEVAKQLVHKYEEAGIPRPHTLKHVDLKYIPVGVFFSLWLFNDFALMEPYHLGKREGVAHLCGFPQIIIFKNDENYHLLEKHFETLWQKTQARSRPVF